MIRKMFSEVVSVEMIESQMDDPVIKDLHDNFEQIIEISENSKSKLISGISYYRHKEIKKIMSNIDSILKKRFGIGFQHINGKDIGYGVMTIPPINMNVLAGDIEGRFNYYKYRLGKTGCNPKYNKCPTEVKSTDINKNIIDLWKDDKSIAYRNYISYMELEKVLSAKGIKINLEKAYISGLPKDYNVILLTDFFYLLNEIKLNANELVATLLHEVGHAFTHIENSYRTVRVTTVLLDTLRRNLKGGMKVNKVLNIVNKDVLHSKDDISNLPESVALIRVIDSYMSTTLKLNAHDTHSYTDSEQLADQFSTRFGMGTSLSSALVKMNLPPEGFNSFGLNMYSLLVVIDVLLEIILFPVTIALVILEFIFYLFNGGSKSNETTYDDELRRLMRIKNDMVRIVRTSDLDKKTSKRILSEIEYVIKIMENIDTKDSMISRFGDMFLKKNRNKSRFTKLEEYLEDLSENDLHIASLKLKQ